MRSPSSKSSTCIAPKIGFLGAYSIGNTGDAIVGYATRQAVRGFLPGATCVAFAPTFTHPLVTHDYSLRSGIDAELVAVPPSSDVSWVDGLDALVIGGGGIAMMFDEFRPFFLGEPATWHERGIPAAWNGVGSQHHAWHLADVDGRQRIMRECCAALSYVSVRNRTSAKFVRQSGYRGEVYVIPDPAIWLDPPPRAMADAILDLAGVPKDALLVGISVGNAIEDARASWFFDALGGALSRLAASDDAIRLVLFPFGHVYRDAGLQAHMHRRLPAGALISDELTPLQCSALVARMDAYIGTRFHAIIGAFAADVPFLALDEYLSCATGSSKIRDFVVDNDLEHAYLCPFLELDPEPRLRHIIDAARAGGPHFARQRGVARRRLSRHYSRMLSRLGLVDDDT